MTDQRSRVHLFLVAAIVAAPFLGLLINPDLGLGVLIAALAATIALVWGVRTDLPPAHRRRLMLIVAGLVALLAAAVTLLVIRRFG